MKTLFLISLLLISSPALSCDSFEECMDLQKQYENRYGQATDYPLQKAIAYKLDEISKKLDNLPPPDPFRQMAMKAAKKDK